MDTYSQRLRDILAQGWVMMFIAFVANIVLDISRCSVMGTCTQWADHLGLGGVKLVTGIMVLYMVMPVLIRAVSALWFRFLTVGLTVLITLFYIAHQLTHLMTGDKPFGIYHALDVTHHVLGVAMVVVGVLWVRAAGTSAVAFDPAGELS